MKCYAEQIFGYVRKSASHRAPCGTKTVFARARAPAGSREDGSQHTMAVPATTLRYGRSVPSTRYGFGTMFTATPSRSIDPTKRPPDTVITAGRPGNGATAGPVAPAGSGSETWRVDGGFIFGSRCEP